jgi:phospholipid transport system substrate-binding protein
LRHALQRDAATIAQEPDKVIALIRQHVIPNVDVETSSRLILGQYWRTASAAQRATFTATFADALLHVYGVYASFYTDAHVDYLGTFPVAEKPAAVQVRTVVRATNGRIARVDYRMAQRSGAWKAIDASVDGISIIRTYRAALNEEIQRIGLDGVIARMNKQPRKARVTSFD